MPFDDAMFDLVTAVETHFWWPDLPLGVREVRRVLKPGASIVVVAEVYKGATTRMAKLVEQYAPRTGIKLLTVPEHLDLLMNAGYEEIRIVEEPRKGWICAIGRKPLS